MQPQTNRSVGKPMLVKGNAGSMNSKPVSRSGFSSPNKTHRSSGGLNENVTGFPTRLDMVQQLLNVGFDYYNLPSSDGSHYWSDNMPMNLP